MDTSIIDAHLHLDLKEQNPLTSLLAKMDEEDIEKCVLILNMPAERKTFLKDIQVYNQNKGRFIILSGINVHDESSINEFEQLMNLDCTPGIKIHPRLFELTLDDIPWYIDFCEKYPGLPIMIDSLFYGEMIEHHIGVEYGVHLARHFKDRKIIMAHSGSLDFLKCMMATRYLNNVYYDYSFIQSFFKNTSLRLDMVEFLRRTSFRIMYGSDYPSFKLAECKNDFAALITEAGLSEKQTRDVLYNNALEVYGDRLSFLER